MSVGRRPLTLSLAPERLGSGTGRCRARLGRCTPLSCSPSSSVPRHLGCGFASIGKARRPPPAGSGSAVGVETPQAFRSPAGVASSGLSSSRRRSAVSRPPFGDEVSGPSGSRPGGSPSELTRFCRALPHGVARRGGLVAVPRHLDEAFFLGLLSGRSPVGGCSLRAPKRRGSGICQLAGPSYAPPWAPKRLGRVAWWEAFSHHVAPPGPSRR